MSEREVIEKLVDAWEALRGGRRVSTADVERWLANDMAPAIDLARRQLGRLRPDGTTP